MVSLIFLAMLLWLHMTLLRRQLQRSQEFPWILPSPLPQCRLDWQMVLGELAWPQRLLVVRLTVANVSLQVGGQVQPLPHCE